MIRYDKKIFAPPIKEKSHFRCNEEYDLHIAVVNYLEVMALPEIIWYHPPNGERRDVKIGAKLKRMGAKAGVPDLKFTLHDGRDAYIELKSLSGRLNDSQKRFKAKCLSYDPPVPYVECRTLDETIKALEAWGIVRKSFIG